jgi:HEAT repeat protein
MPSIKTYGRNPTLGEVREYYAREDVLAFLGYACKKRKVIFSFKDEPSLGSERRTPPLEPRDTEHLHQIVTEAIEKNMEGMTDDARPYAYPSFHSMTAKDGDIISDFVMEADCQGWRRSFVDVRGAIEILKEFQVPCIAKFSGHRSLHVVIPREAFPDEFKGAPIAQSWKYLEKHLRDFFSRCAQVRYAHGTGGILRLPYSLNENTGLVSTPVKPEELDDFRPWEAILHLVGEISPDLFDVSEDDRDRTSLFLQAALVEKSISPLEGKMWRIQPKGDIEKYRYLLNENPYIPAELNSGDQARRAEAAWKLMVNGLRVPDEVLGKYADESNPDVRWFVAEALMGDERSADLLHEMDEYAANAVSDSVSMAAIPFLKRLLSETTDWEHSYVSVMNIHAVSERSAGTLKDEIVRQAETVQEDKAAMLMKCASVIGGAVDDWDAAAKVAAILESRFPDMAEVISQDVFNNIRRLTSDDWGAWGEAEKALIAIGERATDAVILAMGSANHWARKHLMSVLCRIGDPKAIPALVDALGDPGGKIRRMAVNGILKLDQKSEELREMLVRASQGDDPRLRANATKVLQAMDDASALEVALRSVKDRDWKVRQAGVKALGKMGGQVALNGLEQALTDENRDVAVNAAYTLGGMGDKGETILRAAMRSENTQTARCAAHALAGKGDPDGVGLVIDALNDDGWDIWHTPFTLTESGDERALEALLKLVESSLDAGEMSSKALRSVRALGSCADSRALDMLKTVIFTRRDRKARRSAFAALRSIGNEDAMNVLLEALASKDGNLRQHARNALAKMGEEIVPRLEELLERTEGKPRSAVMSLLRSIR